MKTRYNGSFNALFCAAMLVYSNCRNSELFLLSAKMAQHLDIMYHSKRSKRHKKQPSFICLFLSKAKISHKNTYYDLCAQKLDTFS